MSEDSERTASNPRIQDPTLLDSPSDPFSFLSSFPFSFDLFESALFVSSPSSACLALAMPPRRILCKFFAQGTCLKGEYCQYSHDWRDQPNNVCTFYQKGICSYGNRCKFDHIKVSRHQSLAPTSSSSGPSLTSSSHRATHPSSVSFNGEVYQPLGNLQNNKLAWTRKYVVGSLHNESNCPSTSVRPADLIICPFAAAGDCPHGEKCPLIHGDICVICGKHCLHPHRPEEREEHIKKCKEYKHLEALKRGHEIECCICLENVLSKTTEAERKFGLLSECDHPFCISCIRNWRSNSPSSGMDVNTAVRACPVCRKHSYFVVPSGAWYSTPEEKQEIISNYKNKLKSIDCKYFDFGIGTCPFGSICFYKHTSEQPCASSRGSNNRRRSRARRPRMPQQPRRSTMEDELENLFSHLILDEDLADFAEHLFLQEEDYDDYTPEGFDDYINEEDVDDLERLLRMNLVLSQLGYDDCSSSSGDNN